MKKNFIGLCRPADRTEFIDLTLPAFQSKKERQGEDCTPFDLIHESDVLIAILKGSTWYQMSKTSKPILRHPKFKEMIRRRRRQSAADKVSRKKKKRKSKKKHNEKKLKSPTKEVYGHDDCSIVIGITCATLVRQYSKEAHRGEDHTSLSKMETLSKKLHVVEVNGAFVPDCDNSSMGSSNKQRSVTSDLDWAKRRVKEGYIMLLTIVESTLMMMTAVLSSLLSLVVRKAQLLLWNLRKSLRMKYTDRRLLPDSSNLQKQWKIMLLQLRSRQWLHRRTLPSKIGAKGIHRVELQRTSTSHMNLYQISTIYRSYQVNITIPVKTMSEQSEN